MLAILAASSFGLDSGFVFAQTSDSKLGIVKGAGGGNANRLGAGASRATKKIVIVM
jgi:hypothetical protein